MFEPRSGVSEEVPGEGGMEGGEEDSLEGVCAKTISQAHRLETLMVTGIIARALKSAVSRVAFSGVLMELVWSVAWASGPLQVQVRTTNPSRSPT